MGIFNIVKKKPKFMPEYCGVLRYMTVKDPSKNFFDGWVQFQGEKIGSSIDADKNGPTIEQKMFFEDLDKKYSEIKETIILPFLKKELDDIIEESGIDNFDSEFEFDGISIGHTRNENTEWSVTYYSNPMRHYVSIDFDGMIPKDLSIDG
jgi:hypothetical protein